MSTAEFAQTSAGAETLPGARTPRVAILRRLALTAYAFVFLVWTLHYGISVQRELVIGWIVGALACASIGRSPMEIAQLVTDWLPMAVLLLAYDYTRGLADSIGIAPHFTTMIDFDRFVFFGQTPTEWLQQRIIDPTAVHWWDVCFTFLYTSHFILPFALAGVLWGRSRTAFKRFTRRFLTLSFVGLATYVLFPAAPPWMASEHGLLSADHPQLRPRARGGQRADRRRLRQGPVDRQPGRRRSLAARRDIDARLALPLAAGQLAVAAAGRPIPPGNGSDADRHRRALFFRRRPRLALCDGGDGGLGLVGEPPALRRGPQGRPSSSLSPSIASTGPGSTPLASARRSETRSPSITAQSWRAVALSPSASTLTT